MVDFNYLKQVYSGWSESKSDMIYSAHKSYQLIDFLPPLIQVLNGHKFIPESKKLTHSEQEIANLISSRKSKEINCENRDCQTVKYLYMNCWGLIYEVLRMAKNRDSQPTLFMGQSSIMFDYLRNHSRQLMTWEKTSDFLLVNKIIQPGDIVLISHQSKEGYEYLDHIAIVIDEGIYFEKAGVGENVPIRLIDEETLKKIWPMGVFTYELRRVNSNAQFLHPQAIFSLNSAKIKSKLFPSFQSSLDDSYSQNMTVSWEIEDKSLSTILWFHLVEISILWKENENKAKLSPQMYQPIFKSKD